MQVLLYTLAAASFTVIMHGIGIEHHLYGIYWWFDTVTHLSGGFALGLLVTVVYATTRQWRWLTIGTVLLLAIGWEIFEVVFLDIRVGSTAYTIDTSLDILIGLIGAYGATIVHNAKR